MGWGKRFNVGREAEKNAHEYLIPPVFMPPAGQRADLALTADFSAPSQTTNRAPRFELVGAVV
jgi:hypothetical protein